jgi:hypothetical protein
MGTKAIATSGLGKGHHVGGLMDMKTHASTAQNTWVAYENKTDKPVDPVWWSDISWLAIFICLLKVPFLWPWCYFSSAKMHAHRGNMTHLRLCLNGMDKWTAILAHALTISGLTDHDSLVNKHLPTHHEKLQHVRVKNVYLSKALGEDFYQGLGDYDSWLPQASCDFVARAFHALNTSYAACFPSLVPARHAPAVVPRCSRSVMRTAPRRGPGPGRAARGVPLSLQLSAPRHRRPALPQG